MVNIIYRESSCLTRRGRFENECRIVVKTMCVGSVGASTVMLGRFETNFHKVKVRACRQKRLWQSLLVQINSFGVPVSGCSAIRLLGCCILCKNCEPGFVFDSNSKTHSRKRNAGSCPLPLCTRVDSTDLHGPWMLSSAKRTEIKPFKAQVRRSVYLTRRAKKSARER